MARDVTKPRAPSPRNPLDTSKVHGNIHNPPRMMEMGGADKLHVAGSPHKNKLALRKPGGTR